MKTTHSRHLDVFDVSKALTLHLSDIKFSLTTIILKLILTIENIKRL